ncbi:uncharacterized protein LOC106090529 isoform X1 [Stomoxys calcitrans]|uniref:uncharacterized protein LOC106090529 isoform X1 n=1 Tax=Stomoxys calcitrans TaxID=35570 RepID=UPI0027E25915|nr:uncharacterized protein LOC106090529 isoform X1 [Stomoxys calcitrans]
MKGSLYWSLLTLATLFGASGGHYYETEDGSPVFVGDHYGSVHWFDAACVCAQREMVLITIDSEKKENQIKRLLTKIGTSETIWTGGNNLANAKHFKWLSTGNLIEYSNWSFKSPTYYDDNCISIDSADNWKHSLCDNKYWFMCEQRNAEQNEDLLFYVHQQMKNECKLNRKDDLQLRLKRVLLFYSNMININKTLQGNVDQVKALQIENEKLKLQLNQTLIDVRNTTEQLAETQGRLKTNLNSAEVQHLTNEKPNSALEMEELVQEVKALRKEMNNFKEFQNGAEYQLTLFDSLNLRDWFNSTSSLAHLKSKNDHIEDLRKSINHLENRLAKCESPEYRNATN